MSQHFSINLYLLIVFVFTIQNADPLHAQEVDPALGDPTLDEIFEDPGLEDPWTDDIVIIEEDWINPYDEILDTTGYENWLDDIINETSPDNIFTEPDTWLDLNPIDDEVIAGDLQDAAEALGDVFIEVYGDEIVDTVIDAINTELGIDIIAEADAIGEYFDEPHEIIITIGVIGTIEATTGIFEEFLSDTVGQIEDSANGLGFPIDIDSIPIPTIIPIGDDIHIGGEIFLDVDNNPDGGIINVEIGPF